MGTDRFSLERSCRRPNEAALGDRNTEMIGAEMYESFDIADVKFGVDPTVLIVQERIDFFATGMLRLSLRPVRSERLLFCRMQMPVRKELGVC
jgi:hypothetical protein